MKLSEFIGQIFWFGILATPLIAFLVVRKMEYGLAGKLLLGISITVIIAAIFYGIAMAFIFKDGMGP